MKLLKYFGMALIAASLVACSESGQGVTEGGQSIEPDKPVVPQGPSSFTQVVENYDDWSGEYLITWTSENKESIYALGGWNDDKCVPVKGRDGEDVNFANHKDENGLSAEQCKKYSAKIVNYNGSYTINIKGLGYIGLEVSSDKLVHIDKISPLSRDKYMWIINFRDSGIEFRHAVYSDRVLQWNPTDRVFSTYKGDKSPLTIYKDPRPSSVDQNLPKFYVEELEDHENWEGNYLLAWRSEDKGQIYLASSADDKILPMKGADGKVKNYASKLTKNGLPIDDCYESNLKVVNYNGSYAIILKNGDYVGLMSDSDKICHTDKIPALDSDKYMWMIVYEGGAVRIRHAVYSDREIQWDSDAQVFSSYKVGAQKGITLYKNLNPTYIPEEGGSDKPDVNPDVKPDKPDVKPEIPTGSITIKDFITKSTDDKTFYQLTGTISTVTNTDYGNFTMYDESGEIFVWGLTKTQLPQGEKNDKSFGSLGLKVGDVVTLRGQRGYFADKHKDEVVNAYYVSHVPGSGSGEGGHEGGGSQGGGSEVDPNPGKPGVNTGKRLWAELPAINDADGNRIDDGNNDLYYAFHMCDGPEKTQGHRARNYTVCYSASNVCPAWVAAPRHQMYENKGCNRTNAYRQDPDIPSKYQVTSKETGGGCNKGHMLGSAERLSSAPTNRQVFYYSNIAPQDSGTHNTGGGAWNNLEDKIDSYVCADTLYQIIGCFFDKWTDSYGNIASPRKIHYGGRSDVTRPTGFYAVLLRTKSGRTGKAVRDCSKDELQCVAFVVSHAQQKGHKPQKADMMTVSQLEKMTGFTYFVNVPNAPKDTFNPRDWGIN